MKKIVVTGGTGFLGKRLSEKLSEIGYDVTALGRNDRVGIELEKNGIRYERVDLADKKKLNEIFRNVDIVFHCAAKSSLWGKYEEFYAANVIGTDNVIDAVKSNKVSRMVYVSSPTIYYDNEDFNDFNKVEKKPKKFINYYAETKWLAQEAVDRSYIEGLNTISIIPRGIFGPGDTSIFPRLLKINERVGIPLIKNGEHIIELTYIDNVVDALILCIETKESNFGKKYFITNNERFVFKELIKAAFKEVNVKPKFKKKNYIALKVVATIIESFYKLFGIWKEPPITKYSVEILYRNQMFDITNSVNELGYKPKISVEDGIKLFGEWWLKNGKEV